MPHSLKQFSRAVLSGVAIALLASSAVQAAPQATTIQLNYGGSGPCKFNAASGVNIDGTTGQMSATGQFDPASNCPTGGGTTGPAAITMNTDPVTVDPNQAVSFTWKAVADVCRFDGSVLPSQVSGWSSSGDACIGANNCGTQHTVSFTPANAGNYTFKLTCTSGAQPQAPVSKTKTVTVTGTSEPPVGSCPTFQGGGVTVTRQTVADVSDNSGTRKLRDVAVTTWSNVFGYAWGVYPTLPRYGWPGSPAGTTKLFMKKNQYWALEFTIPSDFPLTEFNTTLPNQYYPLGGWQTNASNTTGGLKVSVAISEDCGDFTQPAPSDPRYACYKEYTVETGFLLNWVVTPSGQPIASACNLQRGKHYFLNIIAAPFGNPTQSYCTDSTCRFNMQQRSNIPSGPVCTGDPNCQ